jgi:hypothetical protein
MSKIRIYSSLDSEASWDANLRKAFWMAKNGKLGERLVIDLGFGMLRLNLPYQLVLIIVLTSVFISPSFSPSCLSSFIFSSRRMKAWKRHEHVVF